MMYVEFMKKFLPADSSKHMAVRLISASSQQKRFNPLSRHDDIMYVEFMKNFLLSDSSKLMAVRLVSASCARERLNPTF